MAKTNVLYVRCSQATITRFRMYVIMSGSKNYEEALNRLLDLANVPKKEIKSI